MTPLGLYLREERRKRGISQKEMAAGLDVSTAYLSALEHGKRGSPSFEFLQRITGYLNIIWDEAEELQRIARFSRPVTRIDTSELSAEATELVNRFADQIADLDEHELAKIADILTQKSADR